MSVKRPRCEGEGGVEEGGPNLLFSAWQEDTETVKERDMYLLQNNIYTDVTFVLGHEKQSISCHRLFLAKSSPVFNSMLFGEMHKNASEIYVPDVTPQAFRILLKYIYSEELQIESYEAAWEVLYAAKKYVMPHLCVAQIRGYLRKCIQGYKAYYLWSSIYLAAQCEEQDLLDIAWQQVKADTSEVMLHENFLTTPLSIVLSLVQQEDLNCTELELFNACLKWAKHEAVRQNVVPDPANIRRILTPVLPYIRVLNFERLEPLKEILTELEFYYTCQRKLPPNFCTNETQRHVKKSDNFVVFAESKIECPTCIKEGVIPEFTYTQEASGMFDKENKVVYGVEIPTQVKENPVNDTYDEKFTVFFIQHTEPDHSNWYRDTDLDPKDRIIEVYKFKSSVKYNSKVKVHFENPSSYDFNGLFYFEIIFHKSGRYPNKGDKFLTPICDDNPSDDEEEEDSDSD